jgi:cytochrome P450
MRPMVQKKLTIEGGHTLPPGPKTRLPGFAFLKFRNSPLTFLEELARKYGDVVYFRLGPQPAYFLNHPDFVKQVLVTGDSGFMKGRALQRSKRLLGEGLLTSEPPLHKRQRRLVQPAFHRQRIAGYADTMASYAERACGRWQDGTEMNIAHEMMRLTLAIVGKTLFDADVEEEAVEIGEALTTVIHLFDLLLMPFSEVFEKLPLPQMKRLDKARNRLDQTIYRMIEDRRKSNSDRGDLLSMLLMAQDDEEGGAGMSDTQLRDEMMTLFLAGHETTANAMSWTWYLLSQNPDAEARLHDEIDSKLGNRLPTFHDVAELRYTEMVFAESMRLYPPAWAIGRLATEGHTIGSYNIPKGSLVLLSQYIAHRDPRFFPNPTVFDPERWTPEAKEARPQYSYFPFGGGPRRCIGESFAWMEGVLLLATIARKWRFRTVPGQKIEPQALITLRPRNGIKVAAHRREP